MYFRHFLSRKLKQVLYNPCVFVMESCVIPSTTADFLIVCLFYAGVTVFIADKILYAEQIREKYVTPLLFINSHILSWLECEFIRG